MTLSTLILEFLSEEHKKKLKRLAAAGGLAALGAGAHIAYTRHQNKKELERDKRDTHIFGGISDAVTGYANHTIKQRQGHKSKLHKEIAKSLIKGRAMDAAIQQTAHAYTSSKYGFNPFVDKAREEAKISSRISNTINGLQMAHSLYKLHKG